MHHSGRANGLCRSTRNPSRSSTIVVNAKSTSTSGKLTMGRITGRAPILADPVDFESVGFRFDPANNRWAPAPRAAKSFELDVEC